MAHTKEHKPKNIIAPLMERVKSLISPHGKETGHTEYNRNGIYQNANGLKPSNINMGVEQESSVSSTKNQVEKLGGLAPEELRNQIENYYSLGAEEQTRVIDLLRADDPVALREWYRVFGVILCEDSEPIPNEEVSEALDQVANKLLNDPQISKIRQDQIAEVINGLDLMGEMGVPIQSPSFRLVFREDNDPNEAAEEVINLLGTTFMALDNPHFILKVIHIPVRLMDSNLADWQVAKLIPTTISIIR